MMVRVFSFCSVLLVGYFDTSYKIRIDCVSGAASHSYGVILCVHVGRLPHLDRQQWIHLLSEIVTVL